MREENVSTETHVVGGDEGSTNSVSRFNTFLG